MKNDEFAFLNQQLAAMLRDGIPLEGALRRLCADLQHGPLRTELQLLEADLARGTPLTEAIRPRQLPDLYKRMLEVGAQSHDLPGVLTLLADHYQRKNAIWTRLKGLMVYPLLVLTAAFLLAAFLSLLLHEFLLGILGGSGYRLSPMALFGIKFGYLISPLVIGSLLVVLVVAVSTPKIRRLIRWRVPAFREASLAGLASTLALMLRSGVPLDSALALVAQLEAGTPAGDELARWRQNLAAGRGKFSEMAANSKVFPPLFVWMVGHAGEDLAAGFQRVAETYQSRSHYRSDLLLYSALPCAVLGLGLMIIIQIQPVISVFTSFINGLSGE